MQEGVSPGTVGEQLDRFLDDLTIAGYSPLTIKHYRWKLRKRLPLDIAVYDLTMATLRALVADQVRTKAPGTAHTFYGMLRSFSKYLKTSGMTAINLMDGIPEPRLNEPRTRALSPEQMRRLWQAAVELDNECMVGRHRNEGMDVEVGGSGDSRSIARRSGDRASCSTTNRGTGDSHADSTVWQAACELDEGEDRAVGAVLGVNIDPSAVIDPSGRLSAPATAPSHDARHTRSSVGAQVGEATPAVVAHPPDSTTQAACELDSEAATSRDDGYHCSGAYSFSELRCPSDSDGTLTRDSRQNQILPQNSEAAVHPGNPVQTSGPARVRSVCSDVTTLEGEDRANAPNVQASDGRVSYRLLFALLRDTGLRRAEVAGARWEDIDGDVLRVLGKGRKWRRVLLTPEVLRLLKMAAESEDVAVTLCASDQRGLGALPEAFSGQIPSAPSDRSGVRCRRPSPHPTTRGPIFGVSPSRIGQMFAQIARRAGVKATAHQLRHTYFTDFVARGGSISHAVTLGGWSNDTQLVRRYAKSAMEEAALMEARRMASGR